MLIPSNLKHVTLCSICVQCVHKKDGTDIMLKVKVLNVIVIKGYKTVVCMSVCVVAIHRYSWLLRLYVSGKKIGWLAICVAYWKPGRIDSFVFLSNSD